MCAGVQVLWGREAERNKGVVVLVGVAALTLVFCEGIHEIKRTVETQRARR